jgi:N-acetyl-beta-hexosaminidase
MHQVIGGIEQPLPSNADSTPPVSTISCNGSPCAGWYGSPVAVSLSATDSGAGVAFIRYTTDGSDPSAASPQYSGPFTVNATTTLKYAAWDTVGNAEATKSQAVQIDTAAPVSSIQCNGAACSSNTYSAPVSVSLSAADSGGSGVAAIRYTTDGSDPTSSSTLYTSSFTVSATTTVKYRAWDNAGNLEATKSQLIQVATTQADTTPPTSVIRCNGAACSTGWYAAAVSVSLSATDNSGGSGVVAIRYTTDGSDPTSSSTLYTGTPFTVSATTTVKYRAWDNAGNAEATKSQLVRIDTTVPTVTLTSPTNGATVTRNVKIIATASDGGSGVARVEFYVDTQLVGTSTSSPYSVSWNTKKVTTGSHTIKAVAFDAAGNSAPSTVITVTVQ